MTRTRRVPAMSLRLGGSAVARDVLARVSGVVVRQRANLPAQLALTLRDDPPAGADLDAPVRVDVEGEALPLFTGRLRGMEHHLGPDGSRRTVLLAYDALDGLRRITPVVAHERVTIGRLASQWAGEVGVAVVVHSDGPESARTIQHGQPALEVLQDLSARSGVLFHAREDALHLFGPAGIGEPVTLTREVQLREARVEVTAPLGGMAVSAAAWDPLSSSTFTGSAGGGGPVAPLTGVVASSQAEVDAVAAAEATRRARGHRALWAVVDGDARLSPGTSVVLPDLPGGDEPFLLTEVTHRLDDRHGFQSEVATGPPPAPEVEPVTIQLATVERVDDPDAAGRVAVSLDAFCGVGTAWLQVVAPGAGPGRGLAALPAVGDRVLVLAVGGDVGRGVVLGGLWGPSGPPDAGVEGGDARRVTLSTPAGHRITLDDHGHLVRVHDAAGSFLELGADRVRLHAAVDLAIEAPGRSVTLTGRTVDFVEA